MTFSQQLLFLCICLTFFKLNSYSFENYKLNYKSIECKHKSDFSLYAGVPAQPPKERGPPKKKPKDDVIQVSYFYS